MASSQQATTLFKIARRSLFYPFIGVLIGMLASSPVFPGCKVDFGGGATGCEILGADFGELLEFISFTGMTGFMIALFIIAPFCFIVGAIIEAKHLKKSTK
jgi:hypothetical protein